MLADAGLAVVAGVGLAVRAAVGLAVGVTVGLAVVASHIASNSPVGMYYLFQTTSTILMYGND